MSSIQAIGLNAQGFANAILFCLLTKEVRKRLSRSLVNLRYCCLHWIKCGCRQDSENYLDHESLQDESSSIQLESSVNFGNDYGTTT